MTNAAREGARALAVGQISTEDEMKDVVNGILVDWGVNFDPQLHDVPDPNDPNDNEFTVLIEAPLTEAAIIDYLGIFDGKTLSASASVRQES